MPDRVIYSIWHSFLCLFSTVNERLPFDIIIMKRPNS